MPSRSLPVYLEDILLAIQNIESFTFNMSFKDYESNIQTQFAVERAIIIVAEALKRAILVDPDLSVSNSRKIIGTRNFLTHEYDKVSCEEVWAIVRKHIPVLKKEVEELLNQK